MVGWHHRLNGHELEQAPRVGDGQGGLVCCSPWGRKELDTTEQLNKTVQKSTKRKKERERRKRIRKLKISLGRPKVDQKGLKKGLR